MNSFYIGILLQNTSFSTKNAINNVTHNVLDKSSGGDVLCSVRLRFFVSALHSVDASAAIIFIFSLHMNQNFRVSKFATPEINSNTDGLLSDNATSVGIYNSLSSMDEFRTIEAPTFLA